MKRTYFRFGSILELNNHRLRINRTKSNDPDLPEHYLYQEAPQRKFISSLWPTETPNVYLFDVLTSTHKLHHRLTLTETRAEMELLEAQPRSKSKASRGVAVQ